MPQSPVVIAIDGPAGAGKSTIARAVARALGFTYLDTGAMYRALTLKALRQKVDLTDERSLVALARATSIDVGTAEDGRMDVLLDGDSAAEEIRSPEVTNNTFYIARIAGVREVMVARQRQIAREKNVVVEGRDIGTVVFPHATKKFYLDADFTERARRRVAELKGAGAAIDENAVAVELKERDTKDITRSIGPLKKADDAVVIDSTRLSIPQVVDVILKALSDDR